MIIEEQLKKENAKDFVLEVLRQYATTVSVSNTVGADWLESVIQQHIDQHFFKSEL